MIFPTSWTDWLDSFSLLAVVIACIVHYAANLDKHSEHCERWGFIATGAGAFGLLVYLWWPKVESFPFDTLMHAGMGLIALSLMRGKMRALLSLARGHIERRIVQTRIDHTERRGRYEHNG